jgi:hypothetical protein
MPPIKSMIWSDAIDNIGGAVDFFNHHPGDLSSA